MTSKRIIPLSAAILLLFGLAIVPALALLPNGQQAPDFQLTDLSNNAHKLSNYRGKVVVIDFFGAYCSYCKEDAKTNLVPLYNDNYKSDTKVQFLSIETSGADTATIKSSYLQGLSVPWPVLTGGTDLVKAYDFTTVPTLYVIDSAGKVALTMQYPTNTQTLKATIDKLETAIATPTPSPPVSPTATPSATPSASPTPSINAVPVTAPTNSPTPSPPVSPTATPSAQPSAQPSATPSASPTAPTNSPTPSPTSGSEKSNNTQPAASTESDFKPVPVSPATSGQQSNAPEPQSNSSSPKVTATVKPTTPSTPTAQAGAQQNKTPNFSSVEPSMQPLASNGSSASKDDATVVTPVTPADSSPSDTNAGQSTSADSTSASDTSQGTPVNAASLAPETTDTTNATVRDTATQTGQTNAQTSGVASLPPQPVLEFSVLGLGLPAIVIGVIYLMMRRV